MNRGAAVLTLALITCAGPLVTAGQFSYSSGRNVVPVYEGWERNEDGSYTLLFGYFNRNAEEVVDIPLGPDNSFSPGPADRGQPTRFYPSRNRYWFTVRVPADFGSQELVWTLTSRGKTERAYATLNPHYASDPTIRQLDIAGINLWCAEKGVNQPTIRLEGETRRQTRAGEPLAVAAVATDDGIPPAPKEPQRRGRYVWYGLRVAWFVDRGPGDVTFDPVQFKVYPDYTSNSPWTPGWLPPPVPRDGRYAVRAVFDTPGEYVLRVMAHDGGRAATADVHVTVTETSR